MLLCYESQGVHRCRACGKWRARLSGALACQVRYSTDIIFLLFFLGGQSTLLPLTLFLGSLLLLLLAVSLAVEKLYLLLLNIEGIEALFIARSIPSLSNYRVSINEYG